MQKVNQSNQRSFRVIAVSTINLSLLINVMSRVIEIHIKSGFDVNLDDARSPTRTNAQPEGERIRGLFTKKDELRAGLHFKKKGEGLSVAAFIGTSRAGIRSSSPLLIDTHFLLLLLLHLVPFRSVAARGVLRRMKIYIIPPSSPRGRSAIIAPGRTFRSRPRMYRGFFARPSRRTFFALCVLHLRIRRVSTHACRHAGTFRAKAGVRFHAPLSADRYTATGERALEKYDAPRRRRRDATV